MNLKRVSVFVCFVALVGMVLAPVNASLKPQDKEKVLKLQALHAQMQASRSGEQPRLSKRQLRQEWQNLLADDEVALYQGLFREIKSGSQDDPVVLQAPSNDDCADAKVVTFPAGGGLFQECVDTTEATAEQGEETLCGVFASHSIWYKLTAPANGSFDLSTFGAVGIQTTDFGFDTVIDVFDPVPCPPAFEDGVASNDDFFEEGGRSRTRFQVTSGQMVLVRVDGWAGDSGTVCVRFFFERSLRGVINDCIVGGEDGEEEPRRRQRK